MSEHLYKQYDQDLEGLRARVLQMGGLVEAQIRAGLDAFDLGRPDLVDQILATESRINECELQIDDCCSHLIVKHQPKAMDLRLIMAISKIVTDLERMGDEAEKIGRMARLIHEQSQTPVQRFANIRHAADIAVSMLRAALDAFARQDVQEAERVIQDDRAIDSEFSAILRQLITFMMEDPRTISISVQTVWVAKAVERIGDHAKNIAEQVIFTVKGTDIRHAGVERRAKVRPV